MKNIIYLIAALSISAGAAFASGTQTPAGKRSAAPAHDCGNCPMHKQAGAKKCSGKMCPEKIAGVETSARNIANGVEVTMTAKDPETIAKAQELSLVHYGNPETMDKDCPGRVEGAEAKIENTPDGVKVLITGKTPEVIKKIQAASAREHIKTGRPQKEAGKAVKASKKYACPMKCAQSDKPGKCPKCGMLMTETK